MNEQTILARAKEAHTEYLNLAAKLSYSMLTLQDLCNRAKLLQEKYDDKNVPQVEIQKALDHLGMALAHANVYADEYAEESRPPEKD